MSKKTKSDSLMEEVSEKEVAAELRLRDIVIMSLATQEYSGSLGIVPHDTHVDLRRVKKNLLDPQMAPYLLCRIVCIGKICSKYNLEFPTDSKKKTKKRPFREWFEETIKKGTPSESAISESAVSDALKRYDYLGSLMMRMGEKMKTKAFEIYVIEGKTKFYKGVHQLIGAPAVNFEVALAFEGNETINFKIVEVAIKKPLTKLVLRRNNEK